MFELAVRVTAKRARAVALIPTAELIECLSMTAETPIVVVLSRLSNALAPVSNNQIPCLAQHEISRETPASQLTRVAKKIFVLALSKWKNCSPPAPRTTRLCATQLVSR